MGRVRIPAPVPRPMALLVSKMHSPPEPPPVVSRKRLTGKRGKAADGVPQKFAVSSSPALRFRSGGSIAVVRRAWGARLAAACPTHGHTSHPPVMSLSVTSGVSAAGRNDSGRGPDAGHTVEFEETDADRTRAQPFLPGSEQYTARNASDRARQASGSAWHANNWPIQQGI
eukprot:gene13484-biopygen21569